ncbi:MAG TPA: phytanoyl-CoA dioxygenase family protein [Chitinophagaceae bacterium]|nr:phytanoyl-CoA dioxygenase family protein [Chitinophagaceae bacterium]
MDNKSYDFVNAVINELETVIMPRTKEHFDSCKMFTGSFVVKEPRVNSFVPPHQDWSFTDDNQFNSVTVWTTLTDTDINNGAMAVLAGSHKFFNGPRASPSPGYITPFQSHGMDLFPYMKLVPMKAGQALVFENKTLHASPPNNSSSARVAAGVGLTQQEAPLLHYYVIPGSNPQELQCYKVDREFFYKYSNTRLSQLQQEGKFPEGYEKAGTVINDPKILSGQELVQLAVDAGNVKDPLLDDYLQQFRQYMAANYGGNNPQNGQNGNHKSGLTGLAKRIVSRILSMAR